MALIGLLAGERRLAAQVARVLEPEHRSVASYSWESLNRLLRERPATGAIVSLHALPPHPPRESSLAGFRQRFPRTALVILARASLDPYALFRLGRLGVGSLVLLGVDDLSRELPRALARALEVGATSQVLRSLSHYLPRRELEVVRTAMDSVYRRLSAEELADEIGLTRPHLSERLKAQGLPSLGHLLLWTRLFHAGHWLEEPGRSGESVSRQLDYSSGAAFRRALKLYTGATPGQIRQQGGLEVVFRHFMWRSALPASGDRCA